VRIDIVDRVALSLMQLSRKGPFELPREVAAMLGMGNDQAVLVAAALGYERSGDDGLFVRVRRRHGPGHAGKQTRKNVGQKNKDRSSRTGDPNSPFARFADG
jgi:hypothetical protein